MRRTLSLLVIASLLGVQSSAQFQPSGLSGAVNDYQTSVAVAAGSTVTLTSLSAKNKRLIGFEVWASVRYKAFLFTLANSVESTSPAVIGGGPAFETYQWRTPGADFVLLGSTAGTDAFEMKITNLDTANAADVYCVFHYSN